MSNITFDDCPWETIAVPILRVAIDWEKASMVTLRANGNSDLGVIVGLQNLACLPHIAQLLIDDLCVLALANTIAEIEDAHRDLRSLLSEGTQKGTHEFNHIGGGNTLLTRAIGVTNSCETTTLH